MREVTVRKGEPIDRALKRLKTKLDVEGILDEMRRRRAFETPMENGVSATRAKKPLPKPPKHPLPLLKLKTILVRE